MSHGTHTNDLCLTQISESSRCLSVFRQGIYKEYMCMSREFIWVHKRKAPFRQGTHMEKEYMCMSKGICMPLTDICILCVCQGGFSQEREKPPFEKEHICKRHTYICQGAFLFLEGWLYRHSLRADSRDMSHKLVSHVAVFLLFDKERFSFLRADSRGTPISRGRNTYVSQGAFLFPLSYVTQISESCRCRSTRKAKRALMAITLNTHTHTQREGGREREKDTHTHAHTRTRT